MLTNIELQTYESLKSAARKYVSTDWESIRIQASIAAMQGLLSVDSKSSYTEDQIVSAAIRHADLLVEALKNKE